MSNRTPEFDITETEIEYQVVWFPPSSGTVVRTVRSEAAARQLAEDHAGEAPLIQQRVVTRSPWVITWNSAARQDAT